MEDIVSCINGIPDVPIPEKCEWVFTNNYSTCKSFRNVYIDVLLHEVVDGLA